jgi:hypothetical protein
VKGKAKPITPGKAQLIDDLNETVAEMKLIKTGRLKGTLRRNRQRQLTNRNYQ